MLTAAVRVPVVLGVNVTLIAQVPAAATELPHVFVCAKSPAFVPPTVILVMASAALPLFVRVTACTVDGLPTS
jgi:hypothetical protein